MSKSYEEHVEDGVDAFLDWVEKATEPDCDSEILIRVVWRNWCLCNNAPIGAVYAGGIGVAEATWQFRLKYSLRHQRLWERRRFCRHAKGVNG